ncbi:MAG TPA: HAMP domain-containing sensor histidine kinase [Kofleriaceae bacterium]|nr:HAMP domain-containing sensor histidine kinase [Kofleriaceae bacterium]
MSHDEQADELPAEQRVARLFEAAGYEVSQTVGAEPGTVDWYATPRAGFVLPRTYWLVWYRAPADPQEAMKSLEEARVARKADRALAVLVSGRLPDGYEPDRHGRTSNMVTYRRFALEISGIADEVREHAKQYEQEYGDAFYLRRTAQTRSGVVVDAVDYIKEWAQRDRSGDLAVVGSIFSGRSVVIDRARYEIGLQFTSDPESIRPIFGYIGNAAAIEVIRAHFALGVRSDSSLLSIELGSIYEANPDNYPPESSERIDLLPPSGGDVEQWFQRRLQRRDDYERFVAARKLDDFCRLSNAPINLELLAEAIESLEVATSKLSVSEWIVQLIVRYMTTTLSRSPGLGRGGRAAIDDVGIFEDAALEQFALGRPSNSRLFSSLLEKHFINAVLATWMVIEVDKSRYTSNKISYIRFSNQLIWDYFLARRIARAFRKGDTGLFARYQFSKEYVLLFLAVLAPEVAAHVTADRGAIVRAEIEAEVERRLQLTLGHLVKRSVGAIRMNLDAIREAIAPENAAKLGHEFERIDEELAFQSALADRTGRWQEVPNGPEERVALSEIVSSVTEPLAQKHAGVACRVDIDAAIGVRARRSILREILHCLVENSFHAVVFARSSEPEVRVAARVEGETVLVEIVDSGPGVRAADHERIFEPYFTTKKGIDQPLGTGMGLSIARRYAERIGAVVGLYPERRPTCFFVRLVAWRDAQ